MENWENIPMLLSLDWFGTRCKYMDPKEYMAPITLTIKNLVNDSEGKRKVAGLKSKTKPMMSFKL